MNDTSIDNRSFADNSNEMEDAAMYDYEPQVEPTLSPNYHHSSGIPMYDDTNSEGGDGDGSDDGESSDDGTDSTQLAEAETRAVSWVRATVLTVLGLATITSCTVIYRRTASAQQASFAGAYKDAAVQLQEAFAVQWEPWHALAVDLQSYATYSASENWPKVALPEFETRAAAALSLGRAASVAVAPVVTDETLSDWETFSVAHQADWLPSSSLTDIPRHNFLENEKGAVNVERELRHNIASFSSTIGIHEHVFTLDGHPVTPGDGPFLPLWQFAPLADTDNNITQWVNLDLTSVASRNVEAAVRHALQGKATVGSVVNVKSDTAAAGVPEPVVLDLWLQTLLGPQTNYFAEPASFMLYPLVDEKADKKVVGILMAVHYWRNTLTHSLPPSVKGMVVVLHNTCGPDHEVQQNFSFRLDGSNVTYLGQGDLHHKEFDGSMQTDATLDGSSDEDYCQYTLSIYPSQHMKRMYLTRAPFIHSLITFAVFLVAALVFLVYDLLVEYRQQIVMDHALQSTAIVSSLFPQAVRDRLFEDEAGETGRQQRRRSSDGAGSYLFETPKNSIKNFLGGEETPPSADVQQTSVQNKPIADLFPHCTVLFADIAGFTAWSSLRDPAQVFTLLESIYHAFDQIARKRGVFKVETIGDSYVAVTGLPEPQEDHAIIMSRFARDCLNKMTEVTKSLELTLGPDTGDLAMRFGLHSGPVTAGVLRGERSRFQLFGDTVNTAARMESTGKRDKIQCSQATADVLTEAGKGHWVKPREEKVHAKGKGELQTYWIEIPSGVQRRTSDELSGGSIDGSCHGQSKIWGQQEEIPEVVTQRARHQRLIDYNVDLLAQHLKRVEARRRVLAMNGAPQGKPAQIHRPSTDYVDEECPTVLDEVKEVIRLPNFDPKSYKGHVDPASIELDAKVMSQLKRYVTIIGAMYRQNPFHNFEHASHVTMSVNKLMQRVVAPEESAFKKKDKAKLNAEEIASNMHDYTFGITSDPLTQFGILFSALIHDCDHQGISNNQLIKEESPIAERYKGKSIAEQNSVDLAWDLLMDPDEYPDLQNVIFQNDDEYRRFRQVVVNVVMATDIFDAELSELRKKRWDKAFDPAQSDEDDENRKATIVIEHIMQASDVAHTMQHWHVYQKWNRRLFDELYTAYTNGRMGVDPSTFWYNGEIKFFDTYVIPLAKKLKDCGVFGVSSDECLNYAINNRREWESKGQMITSELVSNWKQREAEEEERLKKEREEAAAAAGGRGGGRGKRGGRFARRRSLFTAGG